MKIVYITPHLSTGGMPEYLRKKVELLHKDNEIWVLEISYEKNYKTIREKIEKMIESRLVSLNHNYKKLLDIIYEINPEVIHFEETSDHFLPHKVLEKIYHKERTWKIIETLHDSSIDYREKKFIPDKMLVVSLFQVKNFLPLGIPIEIIEHEINPGNRNREHGLKLLGLDTNKKHVLQVGLFSNRKNQRYTFSLAKMAPDIQFHFVGALPDNYRDHWEDLIENKPKNCIVWGERNDVQTFYSCVDLVIFSSEGRYGDMETNPLAIKEAIAWNIPLFLRNLPVYMNMYPESENIIWMKENIEENVKVMYDILNKNKENKMKHIDQKNLVIDDFSIIKRDFFSNKIFDIDFDESTNKITITYLYDVPFDMIVCIRDLLSEVPIFTFRATFENKNNYWASPLPKHYYDFAKNINFSGFLIDFYDHGNNLLYSQSYEIKSILINKPKCRIETYEPIFINYEQFFTDKIYDPFLDVIGPLDLVLDIGSSVGLFTKLVKNKGANKITAFEISQKALDTFKKLHTDDNSIELIERAIWDRSDVIKIYQDPQNSIVSSAITISDDYYEVPSICLDNYFYESKIQKVSLMKMDIEGSEYRAFEGLSDTNLQRIENIILEFHDNFNQVLSNKILNRLKSLGFEYLVFHEDCKIISDGISDEKGVVFASQNHLSFFDNSHLKNEKSISNNTEIVLTNNVVIIDSFVYSPIIEEKLINQIKKFKSRGFDIILVSNTHISKEIQSMVNFFFYDSRNQLFSKNYNFTHEVVLNNSIYLGDDWQFTLNTQVSNLQNHGLSVLVNLSNVVSLAKSLGYTRFVRVEVDDIYGEKSLDKIESLVFDMDKNKKKSTLFFNDYTESGDGPSNISFHLMIWDIDFYKKVIPDIQNENDYKLLLEQKWKNNDFKPVEVLYRSLVENYRDHINIHDGRNINEIFQDTIWNTEASLSSVPSNYGDFYSDIFKILDSDDTLLFSQSLSDKETKVIFEIQYQDRSTEKIEQILPPSFGGWCWNKLDKKINKVEIIYGGKKISTIFGNEVKNWVQYP